MHTEPTHPSVDPLPPTTTTTPKPKPKLKPDTGRTSKKVKPSRAATPKGRAATKSGTRPKATGIEAPLPVLSMTYHGKPVKLEPALVQLSRRANRSPDFVDTLAFKDLMGLIATTGGNTVPVLVRLLPDNSHELVYGHRRLMACQLAGLKVNALVAKGLSDEQAVRAMAHENTGRHDLSPLEKGRWYAQLREEQVYKTDGALSRALGVDKSDVSNALALARLDPVIIDAFSSPHDLQYRFAKGLTDASKGPSIYPRALAIASLRSLAAPHLDGRAVYEMLHGKRPVQPATHVKATPAKDIPAAAQDELDGATGFPEEAGQCPPAATGEGVMVSGETDPPVGDVVGPSNTWHPLFSDPQPEVSAVTALTEDVAQYPPAAMPEMPEDDMAVDQTASLAGPGVGPSNVWCPVINAEADEVGAVSVGHQGEVLIQLHVWLSPQQCDLLATALGELLSHEAYKCPGLAHPLAHGQQAS